MPDTSLSLRETGRSIILNQSQGNAVGQASCNHQLRVIGCDCDQSVMTQHPSLKYIKLLLIEK